MTFVAIKLSGLPSSRVFGSGTVLDSSRFRTILGYHLSISPKSVHANVLGEHGDSEVLIWSTATAGSISIHKLAEEIQKPFTTETKAQIDNCVRNAAYSIIEGKKATFYGIAGALARICQAITANEHAVLNVSSFHKHIANTHDICISYPCIIGKYGIIRQLSPQIDDSEHYYLTASAKKIKDFCNQALELLQK